VPAQAASGIEFGLAIVFRPVQPFASAYADIIKVQQQTWAALIGASRGTREANRN
jgi:hypothetical protein